VLEFDKLSNHRIQKDSPLGFFSLRTILLNPARIGISATFLIRSPREIEYQQPLLG
jgi:hypothetical protein